MNNKFNPQFHIVYIKQSHDFFARGEYCKTAEVSRPSEFIAFTAQWDQGKWVIRAILSLGRYINSYISYDFETH